MLTYSKFIHRIQIEEELFEIKHSIHHNGGCQCFKNCDCSDKKGELLRYDIKYSNGLVLNPNGKERTYSSIAGCKASLQAYKLKNTSTI